MKNEELANEIERLMDYRCGHDHVELSPYLAKRAITALRANAAPQGGVRVADAWMIERSDGTKEVVLSPITDDTFIDDGDEYYPLYADPSPSSPAAGHAEGGGGNFRDVMVRDLVASKVPVASPDSVVVPREPTEGMVEAAIDAWSASDAAGIKEMIRAAIAAAPKGDKHG